MNNNEYTPINTLPQEEQQKLPQLEQKTDKVYKLWTQLAAFSRENVRYFPQKEIWEEPSFVGIHDNGKYLTKDGFFYDPGIKLRKTRKMNLGEIYDAYQADTSEEGDGKRKIDKFINWDRVNSEIDELDVSPKEKEQMKRRKTLRVRGAFNRAIKTVGELKSLGGYWRDEPSDEEARDVRAYYQMRWGEKGKAAQKIDEYEGKVEEIDELRDNLYANGSVDPEDIADLNQEYNDVQKQYRDLITTSPEAYYLTVGKQLLEAKQSFNRDGKIVETPYVKSTLARIEDILANGRPVFIHGELGSGKTELAKHLARTQLSDKHLVRWEQANPKPSDPKEVKEWEARRANEEEALVISGHRNTETEQILAARSIKKAEPVPPEDIVKSYLERLPEFRERMITTLQERGIAKTPEEAEDYFAENLQEPYKQAIFDSFKHPVETKSELAPFLKGMQEGRPVIIDEINAIPHHTLILLNDLLLHKPGDTITPPFPDIEPFQVQDGFSVIATGNYKPEDGIVYVGRQPIDAAFLSRFGLVHYDYLPMQREHEDPDLPAEKLREQRMQNELYQMLVARFVDDDLSIKLPESGLDKIKNLATVARNIQDVFSGQDVGRSYYARVNGREVKPQDVLKENVLSIRHMIPILDKWKRDGFQRDLDDYIFLEYVSRSDARPAEKSYIYRLLKVQGDFFEDEKGWPAVDKEDEIMNFPIAEKMYSIDRTTGLKQRSSGNESKIITYSPKDVIESLYGPAPERKQISEKYIRRSTQQPASPEQENAEAIERERIAAEMTDTLGDLAERGYDFFPSDESK